MFKKINNGLNNSVVCFNKDYYISSNGKIVDKCFNEVERISDGVDVCVMLGEVKYKLVDLMAIHFKRVLGYLPDVFLTNVRGFHLNGDKDDFSIENIGYRFDSAPLENVNFKGYYYVPEHLTLCISRNGVFINADTGQELKLSTTLHQKTKNITGGYKVLRYQHGGFRGHVSRHRVLMMTFTDYPDNIDRMQVNHINGIPGDDRMENLEWVTPSEDNIHAIKSGLRTQNRPVLSYNVHTKEIKHHHSIASCGVDLNYSDMTVGNIVNKIKKIRTTKEGYTFKYVDDPSPWISDELMLSEIKKVDTSKIIYTRNCLTLCVLKHNSIARAGKFTKVDSSTISYRLKNNIGTPIYGWQFSETGKFDDFTKEEFDKSLRPININVDAKNVMTGETKRFTSIKKASKFIGKQLFTHLTNGLQPVYDNWKFKYKEDKWKD